MAIAERREGVGEGERGTEGQPAGHPGGAGRNQDRKRLDQSRRHTEERGALTDGLPHAGQVAPGQIADAAVDDAQTVGGGGGTEVVALDQRHPEPAERGIPGDARPLDAAADDQNVVLGAGESVEIPPHRSRGRARLRQAWPVERPGPEPAACVRSRTR